MIIENVKLIYFSPTGTTKKVLEGISAGLGSNNVKHFSFTNPGIRNKSEKVSSNDLVLLGVPVYYGRVPVVAANYIKTLKADKTPAIIVAVYGNRHFNDALIELKDLAESAGFVIIAGAVFIGEHSFSSDKIPIAHARPDSEDIAIAKELGNNIKEKLESVTSIGVADTPNVPGKRPYKKLMNLPGVVPSVDISKCIHCGKCRLVCPVNAIVDDNYPQSDKTKCIFCCACIKACPTKARSYKHLLIKFARRALSLLCSKRKEPEIYMNV